MNLRRISNEQVIFILVFVAGIAVRFYNLGAAALSDTEASWALQALAVSRDGISGSSPPLGSQPAYIMLTGFMFWLFGANNFLARFWPALAGSLLVLAPYLISRPNQPRLLGTPAAMILAVGLALTPGLVVASRTGGSPIMALAFLILALAFIIIRQPLLAGVAGGLALLSGPGVISGGLSLGTALGLGWLWLRFRRAEQQGQPLGKNAAAPVSQPKQFDRRIFAVTASLTVVLIGTFFFLRPQGLAAWVQTLPDYLSGWTALPVIPASRLLAALVLFQPVAVLFSLAAIVRGIIRPQVSQLRFPVLPTAIFWVVTTLFFTLAYPARQVIDAIWILLPLWVFAAWELSHYIPEKPVNIISFASAALIVILLGLLWYTLASLSRLPQTGEENIARLVVIVGIIGLGALITVMVGLGWSWEVARLGLVSGLVVGLGLYSLSAISSAAYLRQNQPQELWGTTPGPGKVDLFVSTLEDLSSWQTGKKNSVDVLSQVDSPSLRWLLRDFPKARFTSQAGADDLPSIVITRQEGETLALSAAYRGQDFVWWIYPGWSGAVPQDFVPWLTFRRASLQSEKIILWARSDLFPGGVLAPDASQENIPPSQDTPFEDPEAERQDEDIR